MVRHVYRTSLLLTCLLAAPANSDVISYQDRGQFLSAIDVPTSQIVDFNSFTADVRFVPTVGPLDVGPFSLSANKILSSAEILEPNKVDVFPFFPSQNIDNTPYAYILVERDNNLTVNRRL